MIREVLDNLGCGHCRYFYRDSNGCGYCPMIDAYVDITGWCANFERGMPHNLSEIEQIPEMPDCKTFLR